MHRGSTNGARAQSQRRLNGPRPAERRKESPVGLMDPRPLPKCPTGVSGLDEVTLGGLPRGRPTLVCGTAGCGKSLFAIEFLVHGAVRFGEPGVLVSFEETEEEIATNVASLGFDLASLIAAKKLAIDHVRVERSEIEETGSYDLSGLFIRLGVAIDSVGAKRVVLDTLEVLFAGLGDQATLRSELRRLFRWLKERGVTAIVTGERGEGQLTRQGLEEYVSDCVILLDHRVIDQLTTRRLRIVKYRGSTHGTNEFPFLIDEGGISVMPITSLALHHEVSSERISTGVAALDAMLEGGFYRGSSVLLSGTAGTGKSSLAAHFADAACARGERCLYFALEESQSQIVRNMRSIGIDLARWVDRGLLQFAAARASAYGLEMHLATMYKNVDTHRASVIVVDPLTNLLQAGTEMDASRMLMRLIDHLKSRQVTTLFTSLTSAGGALERTDAGVSSIMDTWLFLRDVEVAGERNRLFYVLKSRGTAHSNQMREFRLTNDGAQLVDVYVGPGEVLTGSARTAQQAREASMEAARREEVERRERAFDGKRAALAAEIARLQAELTAEEAELASLRASEDRHGRRIVESTETMEKQRGVSSPKLRLTSARRSGGAS